MSKQEYDDATPPSPPPHEEFASFLISNRVDVPFMGENKNLPTIEELSILHHPKVRLRPPIQRNQQQGEQSVSADAETTATLLPTNTEDVVEGLDVNVDELPPYTPPIQDLKQFTQEYYDSQDVYIATFRRILNALIERSTVMKKLCENLQRDDDGNIIIDVHPIVPTV